MTSGRDNDFRNLSDDTNSLMVMIWAAFSTHLQISVALGQPDTESERMSRIGPRGQLECGGYSYY